MSLQTPNRDRKILPRLRPWSDALVEGELAPNPSQPTSNVDLVSDSEFNEMLQDLGTGIGISVVPDLLAIASVEGHSELASTALARVDGADQWVGGLTRQMAKRTRAGPESPNQRTSSPDPRKLVAKLRRSLRRDPQVSYSWVDLAFAHLSLGQPSKATTAVRVAMALQPENRFVLRSSARLFVHVNEPIRAASILRSSARIASDPWLMAAEIAIADSTGASPRFGRSGRRFLDRMLASKRDVSELATAIGTLELGAGRRRLARRMFMEGMTDPTENAVAQTEWARTADSSIEVDSESLQIVRGFEARALHAEASADWSGAVESASTWLKDQPFSVTPAAFGSFHSAIGLGDHRRAVGFVDEGLKANPNSQFLKNNKAYSLIHLGSLDKAETLLSSLRPPWDETNLHLTVTATRGLLAYRRGFLDLGRGLYNEALQLAPRDAIRWKSLVTTAMAKEEVRAASPRGAALVKMAVDAARLSDDLVVQAWLRSLIGEQ